MLADADNCACAIFLQFFIITIHLHCLSVGSSGPLCDRVPAMEVCVSVVYVMLFCDVRLCVFSFYIILDFFSYFISFAFSLREHYFIIHILYVLRITGLTDVRMWNVPKADIIAISY